MAAAAKIIRGAAIVEMYIDDRILVDRGAGVAISDMFRGMSLAF